MMSMRKKRHKKIYQRIVHIGLALLFFAATSAWVLLLNPEPARAADFVMQTGYYVGSAADNLQITAPGWSPDLVIVRRYSGGSGNANQTFFKTSAMSGENTSVIGAIDTVASDVIQSLDSTGFTVGTTNINELDIRYTWVAFDGSDCTSAGTFCVGSYTGNGAASQAITSVGFQPDLVLVKGTTTEVMWRSSAMAADVANFTVTGLTPEDTSGAYFKTLDATGFTVGNNEAVNLNATTYWYIAFKQIATKMKVARYAGNGTDNTSITGVGFQPDFLLVKNSTGTSSAWGLFMTTDMGEEYQSYLGGGGGLTNQLQKLETDGFQVGPVAAVNGSGVTYSYAAFGGATDPTGSGTFKMATGSYVGTGAQFSLSGVGFAPDLVILKGTSATDAVWRITLMYGERSARFYNATYVNGALLSLDSDGFTIGTSTTANASGDTYHWQAFGNAFNPKTQSGAADFAIGMYIGNSIDNRNLTRLTPFQPNFVVTKYSSGLLGTNIGHFRTSSHIGDSASYFEATADAANLIQGFNTDGVQLGTSSDVNRLTVLYYFFAFKTGTNFTLGKYKGTASAQSVTGLGFKPELLWVKSTSTGNPVIRPDTLTGDATQYFNATANASDRITSIDGTGFTVGGNQTETNTNAQAYWYMAWNDSTVRWGTLYSASIDTDSYSTIYGKNALHLTWNQTVPTGCRLWMYLRSTNTGPTPDYATSTWQGPYWSATSTVRTDLTGVSALQAKRYFQYRADMYSCKQNTNYPTLLDASFDFD